MRLEVRWDGLTRFGLFGGLVNNGAVLEASEVKHSDGAVSAAGDEDIDAIGAEANIKNLFVMGD